MLTVLGLMIGAIGVIATVHYARKAEAAKRASIRLEWTDLQTAANDISSRIKRDCHPVAVITPGLTGATFANLVASNFDGQPPVFVGVRVWKEDESVEVKAIDMFKIETKKWNVYMPLAASRYQQGDILIVDDFVMSGDFLEELKRRLIDLGIAADRIRSVSIAVTKVALHNHKGPDYYWWVADDDNFYFPWGKAR